MPPGVRVLRPDPLASFARIITHGGLLDAQLVKFPVT
jgi:hypothetical protein